MSAYLDVFFLLNEATTRTILHLRSLWLFCVVRILCPLFDVVLQIVSSKTARIHMNLSLVNTRILQDLCQKLKHLLIVLLIVFIELKVKFINWIKQWGITLHILVQIKILLGLLHLLIYFKIVMRVVFFSFVGNLQKSIILFSIEVYYCFQKYLTFLFRYCF